MRIGCTIFVAGMFSMHIILTGLFMWTYKVVHPEDNLVRAAIEWPYRVLAVGIRRRIAGTPRGPEDD